MPGKKLPKRGKVVEKLTRKLNLAGKLRGAGILGIVLAPGVFTSGLWFSRNPQQWSKFCATSLGLSAGGILALGVGVRMEKKVLARCVGKPRLCAELAGKVKHPDTKVFLAVLSNEFGSGQRDALKAWLDGTATLSQQHAAVSIMEREYSKIKESFEEVEGER